VIEAHLKIVQFNVWRTLFLRKLLNGDKLPGITVYLKCFVLDMFLLVKCVIKRDIYHLTNEDNIIRTYRYPQGHTNTVAAPSQK
jgi:hypothetical protein